MKRILENIKLEEDGIRIAVRRLFKTATVAPINRRLIHDFNVSVRNGRRDDVVIIVIAHVAARCTRKTVAGTSSSPGPSPRGALAVPRRVNCRQAGKLIATRNGVYNRARANRTIRSVPRYILMSMAGSVVPGDTSSCSSRIDSCDRRNVLRWFTVEYRIRELRFEVFTCRGDCTDACLRVEKNRLARSTLNLS